jgi:hypothetical protein
MRVFNHVSKTLILFSVFSVVGFWDSRLGTKLDPLIAASENERQKLLSDIAVPAKVDYRVQA